MKKYKPWMYDRIETTNSSKVVDLFNCSVTICENGNVGIKSDLLKLSSVTYSANKYDDPSHWAVCLCLAEYSCNASYSVHVNRALSLYYLYYSKLSFQRLFAISSNTSVLKYCVVYKHALMCRAACQDQDAKRLSVHSKCIIMLR